MQMNDASPRWGEKYDFINVPASSFLTATVYDKSSMVESRLSLTPWKSVRLYRLSVEQATCGIS